MARKNPRGIPILDRLHASYIVSDTGCWLWQWTLKANGYGHIVWKGERWYAHRLAYHLLIGSIPKGLQLDHLCRVRHCVNPSHLEPVTQQENLLRSAQTRQTCPRGHLYDKVRIRNGKEHRSCSLCERAWARRKRGKEKEANQASSSKMSSM